MTYQSKYQNVNNQDFSKQPDTDDMDEIGGTELKINPDYYIHTGILKAQACLVKENMKEGFTQYAIMVEHIESLCRSASMLDNDYKNKLAEEVGKINDSDLLVRNVKIANIKIELMLEAVFNKKTMRDKLAA